MDFVKFSTELSFSPVLILSYQLIVSLISLVNLTKFDGLTFIQMAILCFISSYVFLAHVRITYVYKTNA